MSPPSTAHRADVAARRDRIARVLMTVLSLASLVPFADAALRFATLPPDQINSGQWRMLGYLVFAGLYAQLAFFPRRMPGLWELVLYHKLGQIVVLTLLVTPDLTPEGLAQQAEARLVVAVDSALAAVSLACYVLTRGWRAWSARA